MAFEPNEPNSLFNRYQSLKTKVKLIPLDISFLKQCRVHNVFPKCVVFNSKVKTPSTKRALEKAKTYWLSSELHSLYAKRSSIEVELYALHKKLSQTIPKLQWDEMERKMFRSIEEKKRKKRNSQNKKLKNLLKEKSNHSGVSNVVSVSGSDSNGVNETTVYVKNLTDVVFSKEELDLLNKGLKFSLPPMRPPIEDIISDVDASLWRETSETKISIKKEVVDIIKTHKPTRIPFHPHNNTIKSLRQKGVYYMKADKGNTVVIMKKDEYLEKCETLLNEGPYEKLKSDPVDKMVKEVKSLVKTTPFLNNTPFPSNPKVPKMYCLPKIHKPNYPMRPIVANINSPSYNIAKKLLCNLQNLPFPETLQVKNNYELAEKLQGITINDTDRLISFDVQNLFPSVPIPETLEMIENWLKEQNINKKEITHYMNTIKLCTSQNIFQINGTYYKQTGGTAMGNPLSPFLANFFMSHLETKFKKNNKNFPKAWFRYVDDILCIIPEDFNIEEFLNALNSLYPTIKFTYELEQQNKLPFLDMLIIRHSDHLEFDIYRKPTHTNNYIPSDSFQPWNQKFAAFNSMIHRCLNLPLNKNNQNKEIKNIMSIASNLGYTKTSIQKLIRKHENKKLIRDATTFIAEKDDVKRVRISYYPPLTNKMKTVFRKHNIQPIFTNDNKIKNLLGNTKDKDKPEDCSGIYKIKCKDCQGIYIGQTKRNIKKRFKEHLYYAKYKYENKSALSDHLIATNHTTSFENLNLIQKIDKPSQLNIREAIAMKKNKTNLLNNDLKPLENILLSVIKTKLEDMTPTTSSPTTTPSST
ncbi:unnamed protein product [Allacma fusca]|uniref:Reverse transcriptase domain-containing protein n=1 Tax=Allacma fusca TaxID=39272 RepID=A0A8J2P0V6_9HEXA|nr:unnamed protein product [Allacma fusca]